MLLRLVPDPDTDRCALSQWRGEPGRCHWCDSPSRTESDWCSVACADAYEANHQWAEARSAVLARDRERCTGCDTGPASVAELRLLLRALIPMAPVAAARLWRSEEWMALELASSVDVVHLVPPAESYRSGCHHHLDGLVTRCRTCDQLARATPLHERHAKAATVG